MRKPWRRCRGFCFVGRRIWSERCLTRAACRKSRWTRKCRPLSRTLEIVGRVKPAEPASPPQSRSMQDQKNETRREARFRLVEVGDATARVSPALRTIPSTAGSCGSARFRREEQSPSPPSLWRMSAVKQIRKIAWTGSHPYDFYLKFFIAW